MRIIFLLFGIFVICHGQFTQYSPCPNIFKYKSRPDQYKYGLVTVPSPPIGEPVVPLNLLFSLRSRLPTKYGGLIELLGTRSEAIEKILDQQPIRFIIHFPMQSPLPRLELISYQNDILCSAEPEYNMYNTDQRKSIIEFRYSFNTTELIRQTTVPPFNVWPSLISPSSSPPSLNFKDEPNEDGSLSEFQNEIITPIRKSKKLISSTLIENDQNEQCGQQDKRFLTSPLIAGGKPIEHGAWPWLSAIYIVKSSGLQFICTGNLVSPTTVITSAHCFDYDRLIMSKRPRPDVMVFLGRHNLSEWMEEGTEMRRVSAVHIHPEYRITSNNGQHNDANIAIIILKNPINYSVYIRPICLWSSNNNDDKELIGSIGVLVGWGSDAKSMRLATIPQRINVEIIDKDICFESNPTIFQSILPLTNRTLCGGQADGLSGPCHGDSGAGLAILKNGRMILRGLVGVGITNPANLCDLTQYSVYTDLIKFSTWIRMIMEKETI